MRINMGRFVCYILILISNIVVFTCNLEAATLTAGSNSGVPGDKDIPIPINLSSSSSEDISGFNFDLNFDTSRLSFQEVTLGPKSAEAGKSLSTSRPSADVVRVIVIGFNQNIIENGTVLNFTFDILSSAPAGTAELNILDPSISDPQGKLLTVSTENGEIVVDGNPTDSTTTTSTNNPTTIITTTSTTFQPTPDTTTSTTGMTTSSINSSSSSTTTSRRQLWPLLYDEMWGNEKDQNLLLLRTFRDEILLNTETGKEYILMLYANSLEIAILLLQDPSSTELTSEVIKELLNSVESLLYSDDMVIGQKTIDSFEFLLNQLEPKASPVLKTVIKKVKKNIREEVIFKQLGVRIIEY
jgi:hypothetical protein